MRAPVAGLQRSKPRCDPLTLLGRTASYRGQQHELPKALCVRERQPLRNQATERETGEIELRKADMVSERQHVTDEIIDLVAPLDQR